MDLQPSIILLLSVILSACRNALSKGISGEVFGSKNFCLLQSMLFLGGACLLLPALNGSINIARETVVLGVVYGLLLLSAQWNYTAAMQKGNLGVCSTVYSLGFLIPTLFGALYWNEHISVQRLIGVSLAIPAIVASGKKEKGTQDNMKWFAHLVVAMLSSGGLGILQKLQQNTAYPEQQTIFVVTGLVCAGVISFVCYVSAKKHDVTPLPRAYTCALGAGGCFALCNLFNTELAGKLESAVVFPVLNVGSIILSVLIGLVIFRERPNRRTWTVLMLGVASVILISTG